LDAKVNATAASPPPASVQPECAPFPEAGAIAAVALSDDVGVLQYAAAFALLLMLLVAVAAVLAVLWAVHCIRRATAETARATAESARATADYNKLEETYRQSAAVFGQIGAAMETIDEKMGSNEQIMQETVLTLQGVYDRTMESIKQQMATNHLSVQNLVCAENDAILEIGQGLKGNKAELEGLLADAVQSLERKLDDAVQTLGTKLDVDVNMPISQLVTERLFTEQAPTLQQRASHSGIPRGI
jgi:cell division protein FtsL